MPASPLKTATPIATLATAGNEQQEKKDKYAEFRTEEGDYIFSVEALPLALEMLDQEL